MLKVQWTLIFLKCLRDAEKIAKTVCVFAGDVTVCSIWDTVGFISVFLTHIDPNQTKALFGFKMIHSIIFKILPNN